MPPRNVSARPDCRVRISAKSVACLALAGASEPTYLAAAQSYPHPFRRTIVTTDAHAACLGAHGDNDGGVIVAGPAASAGLSSADKASRRRLGNADFR